MEIRENEPVGGTHFHVNGFAKRVILTRRQKATRKWPNTENRLSTCTCTCWMKMNKLVKCTTF